MKVEILAYVKQKGGGVSMVELGRDITGFQGDRGLFVGKTGNILLWDGLSNEAIDVLKDLVDTNQVEMRPTNVLTYLIDGEMINLPLAKRINHPYKKPHWLPVTLSLPRG